MHTASIGRLLHTVADILRNKPIQIFIATHSLEVLAWFAQAMEEQSVIEPDQVQTFHLKLQNGLLQNHPFSGKALNGWLRFFGDPRTIAEDELASPLFHLLSAREDAE